MMVTRKGANKLCQCLILSCDGIRLFTLGIISTSDINYAAAVEHIESTD
jgi:hypothetical protein